MVELGIDRAVGLVAAATKPDSTAPSWFEAAIAGNGERELVHYLQPPTAAQPGNPATLRLRAVFENATVGEVAITDATGRHVIPVV